MFSENSAPIDLEPARGIVLKADRRPRVPEPPPVRVVAVDTVRLLSQAGLERALDDFYVGLLCFERDTDAPERLIYHAENVAVHFDIHEGVIERQTARPLGIEVVSLSAIERGLIERAIEFVNQKGLSPGQRTVLLLDPAGNWIEIIEIRPL